MTTSHEERHRRYAEFPEQLRKLQHQDVVVRFVMDEYACGLIPTMPEALCRMVVLLCADREKSQRTIVDLIMRSSQPPVIIPEMFYAQEKTNQTRPETPQRLPGGERPA